MASSFSPHPLFTFILLLLSVRQTVGRCYTSIFNFGDSISDTGNLLISAGDRCSAGNLPYGETFFGHPTGRFSDGRLIVDFIAEAMWMPFLPPFMEGADGTGVRNFRRGVNFAVAGATALSNDFFREMGLNIIWTNMSLGVQLGLFKDLLSFPDSAESEWKDILSRSLFLVGEIGGNDYNHAFFQRRLTPEIKSLVPHVVDAISAAITDLINMGAKTLVVPGNFPIGCFAVYLTFFENSSEAEDYDESTGCIKWLNEFSEYHNDYLKQELNRLRYIHPHATIIYADYFRALMNIISPPNNTRFQRPSLAACCGSGHGRYNYDERVKCGTKNYTVCDDLSKYLNWDGIHLTEATYEVMAKGLLEGPFADPSLNEACSSSNPNIELVVKGLTSNGSKVN